MSVPPLSTLPIWVAVNHNGIELCERTTYQSAVIEGEEYEFHTMNPYSIRRKIE